MSKTFALDVSKFVQKSKLRMSRLKKGVAIELFRSVINDTPVGNPDLWDVSEAEAKAITAAGYVGGRLKGAWQASFGTASDKEGSIDKDGAVAIAAMASTINAAPDDPDFILTNKLPYAYRIEYDGWSKRTPEGMVRKNARRIRAVVIKKLREIKATTR